MPDLSQLKASLIAEIDDYVTDFEKAGRVATQFGKATKEAGESVKKKDNSIQGMVNSLRNFAAPALAVTASLAGVAAAGKKTWEALGEGAQLNLTKTQFANLAAEIGSTEEALMSQLRPAIRGMLTDMETVELASQLMSLGLAKNTDVLVRLTRVAASLKMPLNDLILTLTNQRTMRFDQLNVRVDGFNARLQELKQTMGDEEAFTMAFLLQAEEQINLVGDASDSTVGDIQRLENAWKNLKDNAYMGFAEVAAPVLEQQANSIDVHRRLKEALDLGAISFERYTELQRISLDVDPSTMYAIAEAHINRYNTGLERTNDLSYRYIDATTQVSHAAGFYAERAQEAQTRAWNFGQSLVTTAEKAAATQEILETLAGATANLDGSFANNTSMAQNMIAEWEWAQAGGDKLEQTIQTIGGLQVEPEVKRAMLEDALTTAVELDIALGNMSEYEGAKLLKDSLDLTTLDEAKALLSDGQAGILDDLERLDGWISTATTEVDDRTEQIRRELEDFGHWWEGNHYGTFIANYKTGDKPYDAAQGTGGGPNPATIPDEDLGDIREGVSNTQIPSGGSAQSVINVTQVFNNELALRMEKAALQDSQLAAIDEIM